MPHPISLTSMRRAGREGSLGRVFKMGSTGNLPVPVGNLPTGLARAQMLPGKLPARTGW